jgi:hypothetical protein
VREEHAGGREYLSDLWLAQVGRIQVEADDAGCESHAAASLIAGTLPGSGVCPKTSPSIHTLASDMLSAILHDFVYSGSFGDVHIPSSRTSTLQLPQVSCLNDVGLPTGDNPSSHEASPILLRRPGHYAKPPGCSAKQIFLPPPRFDCSAGKLAGCRNTSLDNMSGKSLSKCNFLPKSRHHTYCTQNRFYSHSFLASR